MAARSSLSLTSITENNAGHQHFRSLDGIKDIVPSPQKVVPETSTRHTLSEKGSRGIYFCCLFSCIYSYISSYISITVYVNCHFPCLRRRRFAGKHGGRGRGFFTVLYKQPLSYSDLDHLCADADDIYAGSCRMASNGSVIAPCAEQERTVGSIYVYRRRSRKTCNDNVSARYTDA